MMTEYDTDPMMRVLFEYPLPDQERAFSLNMPRGATIVDVVEVASPFAAGYSLAVLVDANENKGDVVSFFRTALGEEFDASNLIYVGQMGGDFLWVSARREPILQGKATKNGGSV